MMPSYQEKLTNQQIAELVNFIMHNQEWDNHNPLITAQDVANLKENKPMLRGWWVIAGTLVIIAVLVLVIKRRCKKKK